MASLDALRSIAPYCRIIASRAEAIIAEVAADDGGKDVGEAGGHEDHAEASCFFGALGVMSDFGLGEDEKDADSFGSASTNAAQTSGFGGQSQLFRRRRKGRRTLTATSR